MISCIVPVFNGERYLRETLESILAQTYRPLQIIVADDGSTDGTAELVASYGVHVEYYRQTNAGTAAARNLGLSVARGDLIAFLDADDLWHPEKLQRQEVRFRARPELDLCITHAQNFWVPELREEAERLRDHPRAKALPGFLTGTLLARRGIFQASGHFTTSQQYAESVEWFIRMAERGAVLELLPEVLVYRRIHATNKTRRQATVIRNAYLDLIKESLDRRRELKKNPAVR